MAKKNNSAAGWAILAILAVFAYIFANKTTFIVLVCIAVLVITIAIFYFIKKSKSQEQKNMTDSTPKIKIDSYHPMFFPSYEKMDNKLSESYKAQDYLFFIRDFCYERFFYFVSLAFRGVPNFEEQISNILQSDIFSSNGRTRICLAFKKLGKEEKIPEFANAFKKFINDFRPEFVKINELILKYHDEFRKMSAIEHVELYKKLKSKYDGFEDSKIYEQVCIFEDEYLHEQFDFFEDDLFFEDWWNQIALQILDSKTEIGK